MTFDNTFIIVNEIDTSISRLNEISAKGYYYLFEVSLRPKSLL